MDKKDGSFVRLALSVVRLNSICEVHDIACRNFESQLPWFDHRDRLLVDGAFPEVRICYVSPEANNSDDRIFIDCRLHFNSRQMWIRSIHVPARHRRKGIGRQLVAAVEATANALGMEEVRILPVASSVDFWFDLNYAPDPRSARVLWKNLADCTENSAESPGKALPRSTFPGIDLTATMLRTSPATDPN